MVKFPTVKVPLPVLGNAVVVHETQSAGGAGRIEVQSIPNKEPPLPPGPVIVNVLKELGEEIVNKPPPLLVSSVPLEEI